MSAIVIITSCGILEPLLHVIQHIHWNGIDHRNLAVIVFEYEYHIKVLQMELHPFEMDKLHFLQSNDEWWL